jgi:uncharacterized protein DUF5989
MRRLRVLAEAFAFFARERKYWLVPLVVLLVLLGVLVVVLESPIAPLLYPLF